MAMLTSRKPASSTLTQEQVLAGARPAVNLVHWIATMIQFPDDTPYTVRVAASTIEEALDCLMLADYAVIPTPGFQHSLHYDVGVKPFENGPFVAFQVQFRVQP